MSRASPTLALLTDFGLTEPYAGQLKARLFSLAPNVPILDLSHMVPPLSVATGAFFLVASRGFYPPGTIFVCVVDPGVGSARDLVCVVGEKHIFLGPDNGLLALTCKAMEREGERVTIYRIPDQKNSGSETFHGRDILAPIAASLALGKAPQSIGDLWGRSLAMPFWVEPQVSIADITFTILHVDRFGNCITNIPETWALPSQELVLQTPGSIGTLPLHKGTHYAELPPSSAGLVKGSQGFFELACNSHSASNFLELAPGDICRLHWNID